MERIKGISLSLRAGEVLGIAGVAGNGQDELLAALSGERAVPRGMIMLEGADIGPLGPTARRKLGMLAAPEERMGHAAAPDKGSGATELASAKAMSGCRPTTSGFYLLVYSTSGLPIVAAA